LVTLVTTVAKVTTAALANHGSKGNRTNFDNHGSQGNHSDFGNHSSKGSNTNFCNHGSKGKHGNSGNHGSKGNHGNSGKHGAKGNHTRIYNHYNQKMTGNYIATGTMVPKVTPETTETVVTLVAEATIMLVTKQSRKGYINLLQF
jgi:hypothetical protein